MPKKMLKSKPKNIKYTYEIIADSIDIPWGLTFLNEKELLVTDKAGTLFHVEDGVKTEITGLPPVYVRGQGGPLDIAISRLCNYWNHLFYN